MSNLAKLARTSPTFTELNVVQRHVFKGLRGLSVLRFARDFSPAELTTWV
jgi:hypothetical protein